MSASDWIDDPSDSTDWVDDGPAAKEKKAPAIVSGVRKLAQGASSGLSDEAAGGVEAVGRALGVQGAGGPMKDISIAEDGPTLDWEIIKDAYKRARDKEREALKKDSKDNPGVAAASEFAGALLSPVNKIMPSASLAKSGAAIGGVSGLGYSEAEDLSGMAIDAATGAALGGVIGKGIEKASPYIAQGAEAVGNKGKQLAERFAARAVGAERGTVKKLGQDKIQEIGRYALDEKLLSPLASTDDVIARNAAAKAKGGAKMEQVYSAIDDANASTFNPRNVAEKIDDQLGDFYRSPINKGEASQLDNTIESIMMRVGSDADSIPLKEAQALKQELGKVANWKNNLNITEKEKMAREAYKIVSKSIDEAAELGSKTIGKDGLQEVLASGKKLYGNAKGAEELLTNKLAREQGNKLIGLTDTIAGTGAAGASLASGGTGIIPALAMVAGKKGLEKYGSQNAALLADKISKELLKSSKMSNLFKQNPAAFRAIVEEIRMQPSLNNTPLPRAADKETETAKVPTKGREKWANDGAIKLKQHGLKDQSAIEQLMKSKKGKELLIQASDLKPQSKAMDKVYAQISAHLKGGR